MGLFRMRTGPTGRKLPPEGNSSCYRGLGMEGVGVGSTSKSCFTWRSALTACRWLLQMLLDPSKSVIKPWLFCQIATSSWLRLEKQQTKRHISFTLQLLPITERPQETECIPVGTHLMRRLAANQKVSLFHPKAPVKALPHETTSTVKNITPRKVLFWVSLTRPLGVLSQPMWSGSTLRDISVESTQDGSPFPYLNCSPDSHWLAVWALSFFTFLSLHCLNCETGFLRKPSLLHRVALRKMEVRLSPI